MLAEAPSIEEQADILHYLVLCYGPRHKFHVSQVNLTIQIFHNSKVYCIDFCFFQLDKEIEIRDLLTTLYEKALSKKNWALVRQSAGKM